MIIFQSDLDDVAITFENEHFCLWHEGRKVRSFRRFEAAKKYYYAEFATCKRFYKLYYRLDLE